MDKHVAPEVPGGHKGLVAALTFIWPLPRVNTLMHSEVSWLPEAFGTFVAGIRFESHVGTLVTPEAGRVREHFATLGTEKGFLS